MIITVYLDNVKCTAEISKRNWRKALHSMARHYNNSGKWHFFKITNIKGCPQYGNWKSMYILPHCIDWQSLTHQTLDNKH